MWPNWQGELINNCPDESAPRRRPAAAPDWSRRQPVTEPAWSHEPAPRYRREPLPSYRREPEPRGREYRREGGGAITVNAVLCGTSEQAWRRALQEASAQVEAAGGGGFREGMITQGCPRGFGGLSPMGEGVTFAVYASLNSVLGICSGTGGGGSVDAEKRAR